MTRLVATGCRRTKSRFPDHAAEVVAPGLVGCAVEQHVADLPRAQLLGHGREAEPRVDLSLRQKPDGLARRMRQPADILGRVEADVRQDDGQEEVLDGPGFPHADGLAPEIADGADALSGEQLEAPDVGPADGHQWLTPLDRHDQVRREGQIEIRLTGTESLQSIRHPPHVGTAVSVLNIGEALGAQQLLRQPLGRLADPAGLGQADPGRLERRIGRRPAGPGAHDPGGADRGQPAQERPPSDHPFSSFFSSLRKRQSVPWAMIFFGLDLINPASCRRSA